MQYNTKELARDSLFLALTLILTFTKLGYPTFGFISATLMHIPILVIVLFYGRISKAILFGTIFGLSSFILNWVSPTSAFALVFRNPLVSILPRILMAYIAVKVYKHTNLLLATVAGTVANTVLVLSSIIILYSDKIKALGMSIRWFFVSIATTSAAIELLLAVLIVPVIVKVIKKKSFV